MAIANEIRENELRNKAKILGCCLQRSPSLTTATCWFMKRLIAGGNFAGSKTSTN